MSFSFTNIRYINLHMKIFSFLILVFSMVQSYSVEAAKPDEVSSRITCLTSKCHSGMSEPQFLHSPIKAKGCIVCHQIVGHTEKSKKLSAAHPSISLDMGKDQKSTCIKCHVEWNKKFLKKKYAHSAIEKRGCTGCHSPHGSDNAKLLKVKDGNQELCLSCHKKNENWEKGDKDNAHKSMNVKSKCLNCHEIHSSNFPKLLQLEPPALCVKCHDEIMVLKEKGSLHTPVKNGQCLKCHSPHYSAKENMLDKTYDPDTYVASVEKSFELCFSCHSPLRTTKFRNGEKNLHELHVLNKGKDKQRGCSTCHEVHGGAQAMQIRSNFAYKKMSLPIAFQAEMNGGNCTTACHGKKEYDRVSPIVNKEGR